MFRDSTWGDMFRQGDLSKAFPSSSSRCVSLATFLLVLGICNVSTIAEAAPVLVRQTDGSVSAPTGTGCSNGCAPSVVGSQVFTPAVPGNMGSLAVFTTNFSTGSLNPSTNDCFINLYNQDTNTLIATSDNQYFGSGCAGNLLFTFYGSQPSLNTGVHYRWDYLLWGDYPTITFLGSAANTVGGAFSVSPVVNAEFTVYAMIASPTSLTQTGSITIVEGGTTSASSIMLGATLPSSVPDSLQLQVEIQPEWVPFQNQPNLDGAFVNSGTATSAMTAALTDGGYHWQARSADTFGNVSFWQTISSPPAIADFFVYNPASNIILQDNTTNYSIGGIGCSGTCDLSPSYNHYIAPQSFNITKITFNWVNVGYEIYGSGTYVAAISTSNNSGGILATSVNSVSMGCFSPYCTVQSGELDFVGQTIPASFYLDFYAIGGGLQGGNGITVSNVEISGSLAAGTISVTSNVPSGKFAVSGPTNYTGTGSMVFTEAPPGVYTITYEPLAGYTTPATETATLTASGTVTFTGTYYALGVDLSAVPSASDWNAITTAYPSAFAIARAWGGAMTSTDCPDTPCVKASKIFSNLPASSQLTKAAYTFLNYESDLTGTEQILEKALPSVGPLQKDLAFLAVDVENDYLTGNVTQQSRIIYDAVQAIQKSGLKAVIYTRQEGTAAGLHDWKQVAGNTTSFNCLPLWDALPHDTASLLSSIKNLPYGGWTSRAGKQYETEVQVCSLPKGNSNPATTTCTPPVDLDVFDPSVLLSATNWAMADDVTKKLPGIPTSPHVSVDPSSLTYNTNSQLWEQTISVSNPTNIPILGPVSFVFDTLNKGFTIENASGTTSCTYPSGSPYVNISSAGIPPQGVVNTTLYFAHPASKAEISSPYTARVLEGSGVR